MKEKNHVIVKPTIHSARSAHNLKVFLFIYSIRRRKNAYAYGDDHQPIDFGGSPESIIIIIIK